MKEKIDILVAGIGTGGTISGMGKYLKEKNPNLIIVGVEPEASPVLTKGYAGAHQIEGIGAGFIPNVLDQALLDKVYTVSNEEAIEETKSFIKKEGILVGISSGAALVVAKKIGKLYPDKTIVVVLPDSGNRYLSKGIAE